MGDRSQEEKPHSSKAMQQWQGLSHEAFYEIFCDQLDQTSNEEAKGRSYSASDIPICSICDRINFSCTQLPTCSHQACEKCLAIVKTNSKATTLQCRLCVSEAEGQRGQKPAESTSGGGRAMSKEDHKQEEQNPHKGQSSTEIAEAVAEIGQGNLSSDPASSAESINRIEKAVQLATKYTHCCICLQDKKSQFPDLLCLDCGLSYCNKCSYKHKAVEANTFHIMVPIEGRKKPARSEETVCCPCHPDQELNVYCTNCEIIICATCAVKQHAHCPEKVSVQEHTEQEREELKHYRNKHSQVMRFFSEQRRAVEETAAALQARKRDCQGEIRKFFSALIKACMDVEGSLLKELEMGASDHTDLLQDHSDEWLKVQEHMQQLMDLTDTMHLLPSADFLPLASAAKTTLNGLLRKGESLAATIPPQMTLSLCLEQSSQRGVVKRIKEIGETALTVNTHKILTLRLITSTSLSAPEDSAEPLVTSLVQLTNSMLLASDFNNSSLKLLIQETNSDEWHIETVLALKSRPFAITKLHGCQATRANPGEPSKQMEPNPSGSRKDQVNVSADSQKNQKASQQSNASTEKRKLSMERQAAVMMEDHELAPVADESTKSVERSELPGSAGVQVAVSSPDGHCMIVAVPLTESGTAMRILQTIKMEKGCWGLAALDDHTLTASSVDSGCSFITLMDTGGTFQRRLRLKDGSNSTPLSTPRHLIATGRTEILVSDHGRKALISASTDGKVISIFTGHGNQRLSRPEGVCLDNNGRIFLADSGDSSIMVISKAGCMHSKTVPQSGLICPQAVYIDRNSQLYVANDSGRVLDVYDLIEE